MHNTVATCMAGCLQWRQRCVGAVRLSGRSMVQLTIPHGVISDPEVAEEYRGLFKNDLTGATPAVTLDAVPLSPELRRFAPGTTRLEAVSMVFETTFNIPFEVYSGSDHDLMVFRSHQYSLQSIIATLQRSLGIGVHWGRIDTVALASTIPPWDDDKDRAVGFRHSHLGSDEVFQTIDGEANLDSDYIMMTIVGSLIATVGLITDSSVTVVASMLVSPLMGPILCIAYGLGLRSKHMIVKGFKVEAAGLAATLLTGAVCGAFAGPFFGPDGWRVSVFNAPECPDGQDNGGCVVNQTLNRLVSWQITSRGNAWGLFSGLFVALPSGVGVALAITGGGINALVGVAISAALLPPVAEVGFNVVFAFFMVNDDDGQFDTWMSMAGWSATLFLVNFFGILVFAGLTFKVKSITKPLTAKRYWLRQSRQLHHEQRKKLAIERQNSKEQLAEAKRRTGSSSSSGRAITMLRSREHHGGSAMISVVAEAGSPSGDSGAGEALLARGGFEQVV